ncbi:MAG: DNA cytosine methyltransferase, partial [Lachnospiraceae bacterium]|nr:DNA cytosine methyltransferase [Lachnospiraceae bacterium]
KYLKEIRSVKESSVKHYKDALKFISNFLKNKGIIEDNVYEIQDLEGLSRIKTFLYNDPEFIEVDNRGLATGGSGKERNLVIQTMPEHTEEEERALRKKGGLNHDNIRMMTPTEWGRLQGFIGYGFINELTGEDEFGFPDNVPEGQQYKQFGNSVSISVVETMADYLYEQLQVMNQHYEVVLRNLAQRTGYINRRMICDCLDVSGSRASYILNNLRNANLIVSEGSGRTTIYRFV